jgi:hypothetical protein
MTATQTLELVYRLVNNIRSLWMVRVAFLANLLITLLN